MKKCEWILCLKENNASDDKDEENQTEANTAAECPEEIQEEKAEQPA